MGRRRGAGDFNPLEHKHSSSTGVNFGLGSSEVSSNEGREVHGCDDWVECRQQYVFSRSTLAMLMLRINLHNRNGNFKPININKPGTWHVLGQYKI